MTTKTRELIEYRRDWEWNGYTLTERADGLWVYEQWRKMQGCTTGRRVVLEPPTDWSVEDEADLDTFEGAHTKAEWLIHCGREVRCLRRGEVVR